MAIFNRDKKASKEPQDALAPQGARELARTERSLTVGKLEEALLKDFPAQDAEEWDRTGLLVGERDLPLAGVAIALDATVPAIAEAAAAGANVLLTHHPAFLDAPSSFAPEKSVALSPGAGVWAAIRHKVALMDFHTALDVSPVASRVLPAMLGFKPQGKVMVPAGAGAADAAGAEPGTAVKGKGYGQLCKVPAGPDGPETVAHIAARCTSVQGRAPRVWGAFDAEVRVCAPGWTRAASSCWIRARTGHTPRLYACRGGRFRPFCGIWPHGAAPTCKMEPTCSVEHRRGVLPHERHTS